MDTDTNNDIPEATVTSKKKLKRMRSKGHFEEASSDAITEFQDEIANDNSEQIIIEETEEQYPVERKKKKKKKHSSHKTGNSAGGSEEIGAPVDLSSHKTTVPMKASTSRYSDPVTELVSMDHAVEIIVNKKRKRKSKLIDNFEDPNTLPPATIHPIPSDDITVTLVNNQEEKTELKRKRKRKNPRRLEGPSTGEAGEDYTPVDLSSHKTAGYVGHRPSTSKQQHVVVSEEHIFTGQYTRDLYKKILAAEVEALKNETQEEQDEQDENMFDKDEMKLPCLDEYLNTSLEEGDPFVPSFTGDPICPYCNKVFSKPAHRNHHVKAVHLKIKPYKCAVCGKAFSEKQTLKVHGFLHTDEKRFECHLCDTSFRNVSNLYQHQKTHANPIDVINKPKKKKFGAKFGDNNLRARRGGEQGVKPNEGERNDDIISRGTEETVQA